MGIYSGQQTVLNADGRPNLPDAPAILSALHDAEVHYGITWKAKALTDARALHTRGQQLLDALDHSHQEAAAQATQTATDYVAGTIEASSVLDAAGRAAAFAQPNRETAQQFVDNVVRAIHRSAWTQLQSVTEAAWLAPMRPVIEAFIAKANNYAKELGIDEPAVTAGPGWRTNRHPWEPTETELRDTATRHAWENLTETIEEWHRAAGVLDMLRSFGLLPVVEGRPQLEDYRWLNIDALDGQPSRVGAFFLANRHEGGPGVYTSAQMIEAGPGNLSTYADAMNRQAHVRLSPLYA